jgi:integrase
MGRRGAVRELKGRIYLDYTGPSGERRREVLPWPDNERNRAKARLFKADLEAASTPHELFRVYEEYFPKSRYHRGQTVGSLLVDWLERVQKSTAPSTYRDYHNTVAHYLAPEFGELHIQALRWRHVRDFLEKQSATISKKRLHNLLIPLRSICDRAVEDEEIPISPLHGRKFGAGSTSQHNPDPLTLEEIAALVKVADAGFGNMIEFACWSGLRTGELIALEWGDIDWIKGAVHVHQNVAGGVTKKPKTDAGTRHVMLLPPARDALTRQKSLTFLASGRIFHDPLTGEPWTNDSAIRKRWMPLLKRAKVRYRRPYSTRDTYASRVFSAGENVLWVAKQMGHRHWHVLQRSYAAWIDDDAKGGALILAELSAAASAKQKRTV